MEVAEKISGRHKLVLLPGFDGTGQLFVPLRRALAPEFDSLVMSYPGDRLRNYDELSLDVAKALPTSPFTLVAESFSGPIALKIAARKPQGLTSIVMSASFAACPRPWLAWLFGQLVGEWCFRLPMPNWLLRMLIAGKEAREELCGAIRQAVKSVRPNVLAFRLREVMRVDATVPLQECQVPILYLNGTEDRVLGRSAVRLLRAVRPDATVVDVEGPHMLLQTEPDECARKIAQSLKGLGVEF